MDKMPEYIKEANGKYIITLSSPQVLAGATQSVIEMREPIVSDMLNVNTKLSAAEVEIGIFANLCMVSPDEIKAMKMRNYKRIQEAYALFTD